MKIYFRDQTKSMEQHLSYLKRKEVMPYECSRLKEKVTHIHIRTNDTFDQLDLDPLFLYRIFPSYIMRSFTQWQQEGRTMSVGDTIVQQVHIPPLRAFSQKLIFGVRIKEIIDQRYRKGSSYETLEGHVERGISTFTIEQVDNKIIFKIRTFSAPGNILTKLSGPFFSIPYQAFCTKAAIRNVKAKLEDGSTKGTR